jgi:hypothetical protein
MRFLKMSVGGLGEEDRVDDVWRGRCQADEAAWRVPVKDR